MPATHDAADHTAAYGRAIADTHRSIRARATSLRLIGGLMIVWTVASAVVLAAVAPIAGLAMLSALPCFIALFLLGDAIALARWQRQRLAQWAAREIDFDAYAHAMTADARLPRDTLDAMLALLPTGAAGAALRDAPDTLRARAVVAIAADVRGTLLVATARCVAFACVPIAIGAASRSAPAVAAIFATVPLAVLGIALIVGRYRARRQDTRLRSIAVDAGGRDVDALRRACAPRRSATRAAGPPQQ